MRTISSSELARSLGDLLDLIEAGETVAVTRHGRVVARIEPAKALVPFIGALTDDMTQQCTDDELLAPVEGWNAIS